MATNSRGMNRRQFVLSSAALGSVPVLPLGRTSSRRARESQGGGDFTFVWRNPNAEKTAWTDFFAKYKQKHGGVNVSQIYVPIAQFDQKVDLELASGNPPVIWGPMYNQSTRYYASRGKVLHLDKYINKGKYDMSDFYPGTIPLCKWNGHWVGVPSDVLAVFLVYNKNMFKKAGTKPPTSDWNDRNWNWDAALEIAKKMSNGTDQFGFSGVGNERYAIRSFGVDYWPEDTVTTGYPSKFTGTSQNFIDALQFWQDMIYKDKVLPSPSLQNSMQGSLPDLFMTGKFAMSIATAGSLANFSTIKSFDWGIAPTPWPNKLPRLDYLYPDQFATMVPQAQGDVAWDMIKTAEQGSDEKNYYPIKSDGYMPPKKSTANLWINYMAKNTGLSKEDLQVATDALKLETSAPGHCTVAWGQYWDEAFQPPMDKVFLNQLSVHDAVQQMASGFLKLYQQTTPASIRAHQ